MTLKKTDVYFESHIKNCPVSCVKCNGFSSYENFKKHTCEIENEIENTPKLKEKIISDIRNRNEKSPLEKSEEILLKSLVKRHETGGTLTISTRGQPQKYVRIVNPRKNSNDASVKSVKNRSISIANVRKNIAGKDCLSTEKQQAHELKTRNKTVKNEIGKTAGVTRNIQILA